MYLQRTFIITIFLGVFYGLNFSFVYLKNKLMETTIDPLKILNLPANYNKEMLRENFKKLALKAHPDKGGSEYLFKLLTQCYKYLSSELKKKEADKQFYELKKDFLNELENNKNAFKSQSSSRQKSSSGASSSRQSTKGTVQSAFYNGERFDEAKFNQFFMENKLSDEVQEQGYKEWMEKQEVKEAPKYNGSFNSSSFNSHFEANAKSDASHRQLIKYQEPEPLVTSKRLGFTELGQESVDDFSGDNKSLRNLNYTDYRIAHTTSRIVDPKTVNRQDFKNIQELERSRDNVSFQMSEEDYIAAAKKKRMEEKLEEQRQQALRSYDYRVQQQYQKINNLLGR